MGEPWWFVGRDSRRRRGRTRGESPKSLALAVTERPWPQLEALVPRDAQAMVQRAGGGGGEPMMQSGLEMDDTSQPARLNRAAADTDWIRVPLLADHVAAQGACSGDASRAHAAFYRDIEGNPTLVCVCVCACAV